MTAIASSLGRSSGRTAAMDRPKRIAVPSHGTCSLRPSQRASASSMRSGVSDRETRVATRSPGFRPRSDSGPTSSTTPTSMPPEPVTGFCILPRSATMARTSARTAVAVAAVLVGQLAEAGGVEVEPLDPDPGLVGPQRRVGVQALRRPAGGRRQARAPGAARPARLVPADQGKLRSRRDPLMNTGGHAGDLPVNGWLNGKVSAYPRRHDRAARRPRGVVDGPRASASRTSTPLAPSSSRTGRASPAGPT